MKTTSDFNTDDVLLTEFGADIVEMNEPIRCNHVVVVFCHSGNLSLEINYTVYDISQNMLLTISPLDIVTLKQGSTAFK